MAFIHRPEHYSNAEPHPQATQVALSQFDSGQKRRRKPQSAVERKVVVDRIEHAQFTVAHLEAGAGPTLAREIDATKILERAADQHRMRADMVKRLLIQRAGVLKILNHESTCEDYDDPTPRVLVYFGVLLMMSANIGALSGTAWPAAWGWLRDRLPLPSDRIGAKVIKAAFEDMLEDATGKIAARPIVRSWDLLTAPSALEMAMLFQWKSETLKAAQANKNMLTSINAKPAKERSRESMSELRRARGSKPQEDRCIRERDGELATLAGVSDRWIRKHRLAGTLGSFLAGKGIAAPEADGSQTRYAAKEVIRRNVCGNSYLSPIIRSPRSTMTTLRGPSPKPARETSSDRTLRQMTSLAA